MTGDAPRTPPPPDQDPATPPPAQQPPPEPPAPEPSAPSQRPGLPVRLWRRFAALGTTNKIAAMGLVIAAVPVLTPVVTSGYDALFGEDAIVMYTEQSDETCSSFWMVAPGQESLRSSIKPADSRALTRWERESKITHVDTVRSSISIRGNIDQAVQIRDLSITVLRRGRPLPGSPTPTTECGAEQPPEAFYVDLDTLPLHRPVSGSYLMTSPHQREARKANPTYGRKEMSLPRDIDTGSVYDLLLIGATQRHYCEWRATLTWWDGKKVHTTTIDNDGRPFRVTAVAR
ncbi:hypothetical protein [Streptomyces sp. NPDC017993]|uniref:hypothetical protein n=1 Tax=Streptomyces sp. NPDC017993 TaxID=3365027 RepID=UPI00378DE6B9